MKPSAESGMVNRRAHNFSHRQVRHEQRHVAMYRLAISVHTRVRDSANNSGPGCRP